MSGFSGFESDDLDMSLAMELGINARQSNSELAKKLGVGETTIRRRLQRLLETRAIAIAAIPSPQALGFQTRVLLGIKTDSGKSDDVAKCLADIDCVRAVVQTAGSLDILVSAFFRTPQEFLDFIADDLSGIPNLTIAEKMFIIKLPKNTWQYINDKDNTGQETGPIHLDDIELRMIRELEANPRESVINLSRKLGINRNLAGRKLQRLLDDRVVSIISITGPVVFGFEIEAAIFVTTFPGTTSEVVETLIAKQRVAQLALITGCYDIFFWAGFCNIEELSEFLRKELGDIPGIMTHEIMIKLALPKRPWFRSTTHASLNLT